MSKKSILEEALLDVKKIQDALDANTKEILRSVAREEIDRVVKESLIKEDDFEEEDIETDEPADLDLTPVTGDDTESAETSGEESSEDELDGIETPANVDSEIEPETEMGADALGGDDIDMTDASDDDVIAIYKKLSGEDEIEIVGDEIHLDISEPGEYVIKTETDEPAADDLEPVATSDDEVEYDIELDDADEVDASGDVATEPVADDETETEDETEMEVDEQISTNRVAQNRAGGNLTDIKGPGAKQGEKQDINEVTTKYNKILAEATELRTENKQFKAALKKFRNMLVETVVFNSNLTYVTKLFMEHSITKDEKNTILKRFDEVTNLPESKKLYRTISNELVKKPITETLENKITKEVTTGTSKQLNESTAYVDPSTKRIIELINRVEKK